MSTTVDGPSDDEEPSGRSYSDELLQAANLIHLSPSPQILYFTGHGGTGLDDGNVINLGSMYSGGRESGKAKEGDSESEALEYVAGVKIELDRLKKRAYWRLFSYRLIRFVVLSASAVTPALALLSAPKGVTAGVAALAFLLESVIQLIRLHDRAILDSRRLSQMGREFRMFRTQVGDYFGDSRARTALLVKRIEEIREKNDDLVLGVVRRTFGEVGQSNSKKSDDVEG